MHSWGISVPNILPPHQWNFVFIFLKFRRRFSRSTDKSDFFSDSLEICIAEEYPFQSILAVHERREQPLNLRRTAFLRFFGAVE
ncbi:hypothetical protein Nepgr_008793 [Nepenthes gracilis]|uniref:Uncharacterized protein n=1 Tax=Nepenthes gracilis TaxID=150966 RepID=A0AAD3S9L8_NEPGR|nr:hypothetical protein Nepgr_008793 [Nepenthes gracilis]